MHIGWMKSPPHRANNVKSEIDGDRNRHRTARRTVFWRAGFSTAVGVLTKEEQEKKVGELLRARGLRIAEHPDDARKACDSSVAIPGVTSMAILHFEAPDLNECPSDSAPQLKREATKPPPSVRAARGSERLSTLPDRRSALLKRVQSMP